MYDFWNMLTAGSLVLNAVTITLHSSHSIFRDEVLTRRCASVNVFLLWTQLLYWGRAF